MSGAELFAASLVRLGISRVFTLVGDHLNDVLRALALAGIEVVHMRHESGVVHAADAYARLTRLPAVSLVTGGPGHTNSLTGIATAFLAASPLIAVSGSRAALVADCGAFQDIDQVGMARPVVKWAAEVARPDRIPFYLTRAYREAISGRMGPVHLTIPSDVFAGAAKGDSNGGEVAVCGAVGPDTGDVDRALRLIRDAERPVVIAGSGVWWADAGSELRRFVELGSLPVYTITMARGLIRDDHPLCFGYADPALNRAAHRAFQEADLFVVLGKRIDYRMGLGKYLPSAAKCVQVDIHRPELGLNRALDVAICADVRVTSKMFAERMGAAGRLNSNWLERLRGLRIEWQEQLRSASKDHSEPMHPAVFFGELMKALPDGTLYSWDGGDFVHWGRAMLPALEPGGWMRLGPLATIGSALPNALAMKMLRPEKPVALITGDGSLGFYIAEMDTLVREKLPVVIIVGNDAGWGLERELQSAAHPGEATVGCELRATRYDIIMQGFGGAGETIDRLEQVAPAVRRAFRADGPYCLNVNIRGVRSPFTSWRVGAS